MLVVSKYYLGVQVVQGLLYRPVLLEVLQGQRVLVDLDHRDDLEDQLVPPCL